MMANEGIKERNPKTGRFLPGNKVAVGNRGNRHPKWGNKNAWKHGFFGTGRLATAHDDGYLYIWLSRKNAIRVRPGHFFRDEKGRIRIHNDASPLLLQLGIKLLDVKDEEEYCKLRSRMQ